MTKSETALDLAVSWIGSEPDQREAVAELTRLRAIEEAWNAVASNAAELIDLSPEELTFEKCRVVRGKIIGEVSRQIKRLWELGIRPLKPQGMETDV